ncbi:hypothetical protein [Elioraea sp.]|uniref:hypothetical protein n=1 Tax=Elioraea sp. TaxID=2185103 RepID=UPI0025C27BEE|nr:hypothetical protein [Elioraea sp.]
MRVPSLLLLLALGACATTPYAWQRPETGERPSEELINACRAEAAREAQRTAFMGTWPSYGMVWGRGRAPGWGYGMGWSPGWSSMAISQRTQELTAFCLRVQGFQLLPVAPETTPGAAPPPPDDEPRPKR